MITSKTMGAATLCLLLVACSDSSPPTEGPAAVATVTLSQADVTLAAGARVTLQALPRDAQGRPLTGRQVTWSSSDSSVATVSSAGEVTGVANGSARITATSEGRSGFAQVTVAPPVHSVTVTLALDTLEAFDTRQLQAVLRDEAGNVLTGRNVTWTTSDTAVAKVNAATGVLTGVDRGTVTITASSEGKNGTASRVVVIRYRSISAGTEHACDIASGGIVWCWGRNGLEGRIGRPQLAEGEHSTVPVRVPGDQRFAQIATYGRTTCGITPTGAAYCWGYSAFGLLGTGSDAQQNSATPVAVAGGLTFRQLAAGADHMCGVTTDDRVFCWGANNAGQLGTGNRTSSATPVRAAAPRTFRRVTAGSFYTCAVATDNSAWCWGYAGLGNTGDGATISYGNTVALTPTQVVGGHSFRDITAGQYHTCGVTAPDAALCWGSNTGVLGNGTQTDTSTPAPVAGGRAFAHLSAGFVHTCGVTTAATVFCWGRNGNGQLGSPATDVVPSPTQVPDLRAAEVAAANVSTGGAAYTCAISQDRLTTWCWGRNDWGQLGNATRTAFATPNPTPAVVVGQRPL